MINQSLLGLWSFLPLLSHMLSHLLRGTDPYYCGKVQSKTVWKLLLFHVKVLAMILHSIGKISWMYLWRTLVPSSTRLAECLVIRGWAWTLQLPFWTINGMTLTTSMASLSSSLSCFDSCNNPFYLFLPGVYPAWQCVKSTKIPIHLLDMSFVQQPLEVKTKRLYDSFIVTGFMEEWLFVAGNCNCI